MTQSPRIEPVLREYFADDGVAAPDFIMDAVADRISIQPQRRAWPFRLRLPATQLKLGAAFAAALVLAVVSYNLLPGSGWIGRANPTPTPTPDRTPITVPALEGQLPAGRYRFHAYDDPMISVVVDVPAGWIGLPPNALVGPQGHAGPGGISFGFVRGNGLFSDPCRWDVAGTGALDQPGDIEVGPTALDLVDALRANPAYTSTTPTPVTFGEFQGYDLVIDFPAELEGAACDDGADGLERIRVFSSNAQDDLYAPGIRDRWRIVTVDVDGTRLIVINPLFEGTPVADQQAAQSIIDSLRFEP